MKDVLVIYLVMCFICIIVAAIDENAAPVCFWCLVAAQAGGITWWLLEGNGPSFCSHGVISSKECTLCQSEKDGLMDTCPHCNGKREIWCPDENRYEPCECWYTKED